MHVFPQSKQDWWGLLLWPFKAYVAVAFLVWQFLFTGIPRRAHDDAATAYIWMGYTIAFWVLLIMAARYGFTKRGGAALSSLGFAAVAAIFWCLMLPYLAR
jgi:hypothetical protein